MLYSIQWDSTQRQGERRRGGERAVASQTPWSGLKCCQWQSDVPLNRITLKVSCHHIPASHYQGQWGASGTTESDWAKPSPLLTWAWAPHDARQKIKRRKNRWGVIGPMVEMVMKVWAEWNTWAVAVWEDKSDWSDCFSALGTSWELKHPYTTYLTVFPFTLPPQNKIKKIKLNAYSKKSDTLLPFSPF